MEKKIEGEKHTDGKTVLKLALNKVIRKEWAEYVKFFMTSIKEEYGKLCERHSLTMNTCKKNFCLLKGMVKMSRNCLISKQSL